MPTPATDYLSFVGLSGALGMAGDATTARHTLAEMTAARHPAVPLKGDKYVNLSQHIC